jgi:hypothetical protein
MSVTLPLLKDVNSPAAALGVYVEPYTGYVPVYVIPVSLKKVTWALAATAPRQMDTAIIRNRKQDFLNMVFTSLTEI